jgi:hypothetical protein
MLFRNKSENSETESVPSRLVNWNYRASEIRDNRVRFKVHAATANNRVANSEDYYCTAHSNVRTLFFRENTKGVR